MSEGQHISIDEIGSSVMQVNKSNIFRKIVIGAIVSRAFGHHVCFDQET